MTWRVSKKRSVSDNLDCQLSTQTERQRTKNGQGRKRKEDLAVEKVEDFICM